MLINVRVTTEVSHATLMQNNKYNIFVEHKSVHCSQLDLCPRACLHCWMTSLRCVNTLFFLPSCLLPSEGMNYDSGHWIFIHSFIHSRSACQACATESGIRTSRDISVVWMSGLHRKLHSTRAFRILSTSHCLESKRVNNVDIMSEAYITSHAKTLEMCTWRFSW